MQLRNLFILILLCSFSSFTATAQPKILTPSKTYPFPKNLTAEQYLNLLDTDDEPTCVLFEDLYSGHCSWYCGGEVDTLHATSCLQPQGQNTYDAGNAHDFDHETAWVEGAEGNGIGQCLTYSFAGSCPRVTAVKILNGYCKSKTTWRNNNRVKRLKMYYNGQPYAILQLRDTRDLQVFEVGTLGYHDNTKPSWTLKFEILDVYPGDKYHDTAISELYFDGIDVH